MKPTNKKEYNRSILGFFAMWLITTALMVFACLQLFKTPKLDNIRLQKKVESLEADSTQQHLLYSTVSGINSTMASLNQQKQYNPDTLQKLRSYPIVSNNADKSEEVKDLEKELKNLSEQIARIYEKGNNNKDDVQTQLDDCNRQLRTAEDQLTLRTERLQLCEDRLRNMGVNTGFSNGN